MKWTNLKINKCPQCDRDLMNGIRVVKDIEKILAHTCGFRIRESRMGQIISGQITKDLEEKLTREQEEYEDNAKFG